MRFETKIAIAVLDELAPWQRLNVTAFLASGIAAGPSETIGKPYADSDGNQYLGLFRQPVVIYAASASGLALAHQRGLQRNLGLAIYTMEMFGTGNDDDNRAVVLAAPRLDFAGLAVYGPRNAVDKVTKGLSLHP